MPATQSSLQEAIRRVEAEVKKLLTQVNEEVVPQVRTEGSKALRAVSNSLAHMADSLDRKTPPPKS